MTEFLNKLDPFARNAARIMIGLAFWTHGGQKLFAWFGTEQPVDLMSRWGIAGVIEFFGGLLVVLGLYHRPVAFVIAGEMAVAYWWIHAGRGGMWWWANRGETVLIYSFFFLLIAAIGGGDFSIDGWLKKRKARSTS